MIDIKDVVTSLILMVGWEIAKGFFSTMGREIYTFVHSGFVPLAGKQIAVGRSTEKHRVSFEEACTIFSDASILTVHDERHSWDDDRWVSVGMSITGRILVVIHSWVEPDESGDEIVRIISARRANERERATYLERRR
jgi:uncharacterized DUF497 family protein